MASSETLDLEESLKKFDRSGMLSVVSQMPEMIAQAESFSAGVSLPPAAGLNQIAVLGMGGSAIAGDLASDLLYKKSKVSLLTNRQYSLPEYIGPQSLLFALSYSGDTEETLSAVKEAEKRKAPVVCITSGGKLKEIAEKNKYPLILIPTGYQPRAALPFLLIPLLTCFEKLGIIPSLEGEIKESSALLIKLREEYGFERPTRNNPAKQAAKKLLGNIPLIFGSAGITAGAALRFKTQLNENSKVTALFNLFPELDHNEIVNLAALKKEANNFILFVLRDEPNNCWEGESERLKKRIEITKSLIVRQLGGAIEILSQGKSSLARIMSLVFFIDFVTVYLAILQGIDPTPVEIIARLKREMAR